MKTEFPISGVNDDELVGLGTDIPLGLRKQFKGECGKRGVPMNIATRQALELWLATPASAVPANDPNSQGKHLASDTPYAGGTMSSGELVKILKSSLLPLIQDEFAKFLNNVQLRGKTVGNPASAAKPGKPGANGAALLTEAKARAKRDEKEIARLRAQLAKKARANTRPFTWKA